MNKIGLQTYYIQTFGCQMNESDSERMAAYLEGIGLNSAPTSREADLIVLNTCSVRQKAEDRVNGVVNNIKKENSKAKIVLTGCIARRVWDESKNVSNSSQKNQEQRFEELGKIFPLVDYFIETKNFTTLGKKLGFKREFKDSAEHYLSFKPKYKNSFQAYVPISTGCNHFCTFCIVPYSRGKEVCRNAEEIIREVLDLVKNGYKDITLLGQTVNRWINPDKINEYNYNEAMTYIEGLNTKPLREKDLNNWKTFFEEYLNVDSEKEIGNNLIIPKDFLQLLQVIDQIPGEWWTTWMSSHPNYMTNELLEFIGNSVKGGQQRPYIHFALQSGSDKILKRMNRRYSFEQFKTVVEKMRKEIPDIFLSTDVIVGFIGESEEDFLKTIEAEEICKFNMIYINEYSPRAGTASARLKDEIPNEVKAERKDRLNEVLRKIGKEVNSKLINSVERILVDGFDKKNNQLTGRTRHNREVKFIGVSDKNLIGSFVNAKIVGAKPFSVTAEII